MRLSITFVSLLSIATTLASPLLMGEATALEKRAVSSGSSIPVIVSVPAKPKTPVVYNDLVYYFKYASSAYGTTCARPNGNTLVSRISSALTDTQGFIARDDTKKEIVVVFRGSTSAADFLTDANILLTSFTSTGVDAPFGVLIHTGFLSGWNSVASSVISTVKAQLAANPGYTIVTSGHSLGGALSSVAGIALKQNFPNNNLRLYTYGQPRTGNSAYARFVNDKVGVSNIFRGVHTTDGVPTIIPTYYGYAHHATEYWSYLDPSLAATTKQCSSSGEDLTCSAGILSGGINMPHLTYYNIPASTTFCT